QRFYPADLAAAVVPPTTEWLHLGDGTALHLFRHPAPTDRPAAAFVILHGAGGHGRMLAGLGAVAQRLGATSVAPDLPGYGHTVVPDRRGVTYDGWIAAVTAVVTAE